MNEILQTLTVYAIPVIFAITLHEAAHGYVAKYFGDNTAYSQGRVSLNPIVHIDIFGTIIIPAVFYIATRQLRVNFCLVMPSQFQLILVI